MRCAGGQRSPCDPSRFLVAASGMWLHVGCVSNAANRLRATSSINVRRGWVRAMILVISFIGLPAFARFFFSLFFFFSFPSHSLSSPFFSLSLLLIAVTQIPGHMASSSLPSSLWFLPCILIPRRFQLSLPSSTCVELCLPTLGALSNFRFFFIVANN